MSSRRFHFLHTYEATGRYWRGLEKAGLIRANDGVRLIMAPMGAEERRFNTVAARGGDLHRRIVAAGLPFVVDRLLGGGPYRAHALDPALIAEYDQVLGGLFLGLQIHEPLCNATNDWHRFLQADPQCRERGVDPTALRSFFDGSGTPRWLECGTLDDYAGRRYPETYDALWAEIDRNLDRHGRRAGGIFTVCEGGELGELAWHEFYKRGARSCMAEVGPWASTASQFMIASLRGMSKAAGKPWGVYYAPWGPKGCTSFIPIQENTWCAPLEALAHSNYEVGPEFGPSSALQRRLFFYAYLAGAEYLYEEWGAEDNLLHWDRGELSSYGIATREFLDFQAAHPDVGIPFAPIALVVHAEVPAPIWYQRAALGGKVGRFYPARDLDLAWSRFRLALFGAGHHARRPDWSGSGEIDCLAPCSHPDLYEIVPADAPPQILAAYRQVFVVGETPAAQLIGEFTAAVDLHTPFERTTDLTMQINQRAADGAWIVGLYNPRGAWRGDVWNTGTLFNEAFAVREVLHPKFPVASARLLYGWPAATSLQAHGDDLDVMVGAGGLAILEIVPRR